MKNSVKKDHDKFLFSEIEKKILKFWENDKIFEKSLKKNQTKKVYSFYDGPPFATGLPHYGHLVASIIKDIIPRYFTMKGYYVSRRWGWDCHGLPIEHEIDKSLGMSANEVVKKIGITAYNNKCRNIVQKYTKNWKKTITRIGRWVDFENDYRTMEPWYMESVWWVFKSLWNKKLIYQGKKVVPFSTALSTVLSNFEASSNYKNVEDNSIFVLFKIINEDTYFSVWTTTPWTLFSNVALCVNKSICYVKIKDNKNNICFWIALNCIKNILSHNDYKIIDQCFGKDLVGKTYEPIFNYFSSLKKEGGFVVVGDNFVSIKNGTGIVHLAPAFGEDDYRVIFSKKLIKNIPCPIDDYGCFTKEIIDFYGLYVKDSEKKIINILKEKKLLYKHEKIVHSYPFCPRSDTPIIYRIIPSWYIKVQSIRENLIKNNKTVNWVPKHLRDGRMGKWLENAKDWAISRNRYWGTPLPIWINNLNKKIICIGSRAELKKYSGILLDDLHREYTDKVTFKIPNEKGIYYRISEVFDCWFESGSMPYAQSHYPFSEKKTFFKHFPANFIAEGLDQTRGWFYTLQVISHCLFQKSAFKNVIVNGIVNAEDGKKMSKRLKNYADPELVIEKYGADALRLYLISSNLVRAEEQKFSETGVRELVRRMLLPWMNAFKFFLVYAKIDKWTMKKKTTFITNNIFDQWIISRLQTLKININRSMKKYFLYNVISHLLKYIEELTNWYIRLNRQRFWISGYHEDKDYAYKTLFYCLSEFNKIIAPFTPFFADYCYIEMRKFFYNKINTVQSVHLCFYPKCLKKLIMPDLEKSVEFFKNIIFLGRQQRNEVNIKNKIPLKKLIILHKDKKVLNNIKLLEQYIKSELNVKEIEYHFNEEEHVELYAQPNFYRLGKILGKNLKKYQKYIQKLNQLQLHEFQNSGEIHLYGKKFKKNDISIFRRSKKNSKFLSNSKISIYLDCDLTEELIGEGLVREVISNIQKTRKKMNLSIEKRINVFYSASEKLKKWLMNHQDFLKQETLTQELISSNEEENMTKHHIGNEWIKFKIKH
ncbi:isoleucine--tRNA ligase [Candidatus Tachikawaea gelatinosa]|uniref:Isoleucine--tRNA ligase n=1 Tax=Candidatus Tachikawaea gelatinosa TaxID=1410383 RepID=A0A090ASI9_9ENTR|nr:isoleucine--tRNA ligase [Candidatus Tachikawaea gelatinosa]BAP58845.1 isoleucine--tRNA ligase [Candidatus Tachikawaea gelatinosa]